MILNKNFFVLSDFKSTFTTRQILKQLFYNASDFKSTVLQRVRF